MRPFAALLIVLIALSAPPLHAALSQRQLAISITDELHIDGLKLEGELVTLWVARGSLDPVAAREFLSKLDRGVEVVRAHLGTNVDEPVNPRRLEFYLSPRVGISHVRGDIPTMVYIPSGRVTNRTAPYLHETVHAVASWSWRHSEWLGEGLANHVAAAVEGESGGYHFSPVLPDGLEQLALHLRSPQGQELMDLIGPLGRRSNFPPPRAALFQKVLRDRRRYAPAFYAMAWSFTSFLVSRHGLDRLRMLPASEIESLKQEWRISVLDGVTPPA